MKGLIICATCNQQQKTPDVKMSVLSAVPGRAGAAARRRGGLGRSVLRRVCYKNTSARRHRGNTCTYRGYLQMHRRNLSQFVYQNRGITDPKPGAKTFCDLEGEKGAKGRSSSCSSLTFLSSYLIISTNRLIIFPHLSPPRVHP